MTNKLLILVLSCLMLLSSMSFSPVAVAAEENGEEETVLVEEETETAEGELLNVDENETEPLPINYYEVSQNKDNDLIVEGNYDMLQDIATNYGSIILERNGERFEFDHSEYNFEYDSVKETYCFIIQNWKLKDRNVVNGEYSVSFEVDNGGVQYTVANGVSIVLSGVKYYVVANEDSEGNIVISGDKETLEKIIVPQVYEQSVEETTEWGGSVYLNCNEGGGFHFSNFENRNGSLVLYRRTDIVWSENGESLIIPYDVALSNALKNGEYTFELGLGNQQYQWGCNSFTYTHGVKETNAEIVVTKGDIIISGDEDFLNALIRPQVNDGSDYGRIYLNDDNNGWSFANRQYGDFLNENYRIQDGKVVLLKDELMDMGVTDGFYTISVSAYGYETITGKVSLTNVAKEAPEVSVQYNAEGDLLIQSSDTGFINSLCRYAVEYEGGQRFGNGSSRIYFSFGDNTYYHNYLTVYTYDGETHAHGSSQIEKIDNNTACIRANTLKGTMQEWLGQIIYDETITICAAGYKQMRVPFTFQMPQALQPSADITSNEDGLTIHIADRNYFEQAVASGFLHFAESNLFNVSLTFEDFYLNEEAMGQSWANFEDVTISSSYGLEIDTENQTIFVPKYNYPASLISGEYTIMISYVPGYRDFSESVYIYGSKEAPVDVIAVMNGNGDLEIRSNDKEWLSLIAKCSTEEENTLGAVRLIPTGSAVSVKDYEVWTTVELEPAIGEESGSRPGLIEEKTLVFNGKEYSEQNIRNRYNQNTIGYNYEKLMSSGTWIYQDDNYRIYSLTEDGRYATMEASGNALYLDDNTKIIYTQLTGDGVYLPYGMIDVNNYGYDSDETDTPIKNTNGVVTVSKDYLKNNGVTSGTFYVTVFTSDYEPVYTKVELDYIAPRVEKAYEGDTLQMSVGTMDKVVWSSSDTSVATVDNTGLVEFKSLNGATTAQVTISATVNGYTDSHTITVKNRKLPVPEEEINEAYALIYELNEASEYDNPIVRGPFDHYGSILLPENAAWVNGAIELQFRSYAYYFPEDNERYSYGTLYPYINVERYPAEMDYRYIDISSMTFTMKPGDSVQNIKLPDGWEWGGWYSPVESIGEYEFYAYYQPTNWNIYESAEAAVTVKVIEPSTIYAKSLTLTDKIGVNFYLDLNEDIKNDINAYVLINGFGYRVSDAQQVEIEGNTYYKFTYNVYAKEMNNDLELSLHYSDGSNATLYLGDENYTEGYSYTVSKYLSSVMKNSSNSEMIALAEAMKEYGNYSQAYFDYGTYGTTSSAIEVVNPDMLNNYAYSLSGGVLGASYYGSSLILRDTTSIRHYFVLSENADRWDYTFKVNGSVVYPYAYGNYWAVEISDIYAADLGESFEVTVSKNGSDSVLTVNYSVLSYVNTVLNSPSLQDNGHLFLRNLSKAIYLYNTKAIAYNNSVTH